MFAITKHPIYRLWIDLWGSGQTFGPALNITFWGCPKRIYSNEKLRKPKPEFDS